MGFFDKFRKKKLTPPTPIPTPGKAQRPLSTREAPTQRLSTYGPMSGGIDMQGFQAAINEIFPGIALLARDINLPEICARRYEKGMIICEKGFSDASYLVGGLVTSHRYAILSNHMANFSMFEQGTNWGLCVAKHGAHFKVLDIYSFEGKTQITLLHLPDDERWKLFQNVDVSIEDDLVEKARESFMRHCGEEVIPELASEAWLKRCCFPLGMDEQGNLFPLEEDG